ncbi:MAG: hypothetical protein ACT4P8_03755 [Betaproteobacteria bacterium]
MKKAQKHEIILRKAEEYARTGQYSGWLAIEHQLRHEGWREARQFLDDEYIRERLDRLCNEAAAK